MKNIYIIFCIFLFACWFSACQKETECTCDINGVRYPMAIDKEEAGIEKRCRNITVDDLNELFNRGRDTVVNIYSANCG